MQEPSSSIHKTINQILTDAKYLYLLINSPATSRTDCFFVCDGKIIFDKYDQSQIATSYWSHCVSSRHKTEVWHSEQTVPTLTDLGFSQSLTSIFFGCKTLRMLVVYFTLPQFQKNKKEQKHLRTVQVSSVATLTIYDKNDAQCLFPSVAWLTQQLTEEFN